MSMSTADDFRHAAKANYKVNAIQDRGCSGKYGKTAVFGCWRGGMFRLCTGSSIIAVHTSWVPDRLWSMEKEAIVRLSTGDTALCKLSDPLSVG